MGAAEDKELANETTESIMESSADIDQFLTFIMDDEEYGVDILSVQEIRGWEDCTSIPNAPRYMRGVINLRGTIVPIIDLRERFNLTAVEYSQTTVVIVLKLELPKGERVTGIVVDAVSDVYSLNREEMKEPPSIGDQGHTSFIRGLINVNKKMVILLDLEALLDFDLMPSAEELQHLKLTAAEN